MNEKQKTKQNKRGHGFGWSTLPNGIWGGGKLLKFMQNSQKTPKPFECGNQ